MSIIERARPNVNPADDHTANWPSWVDSWFYETNDDTEADLAAAWDVPIEADDEPAALGLAELVEHQATAFRAWKTEAGDLIARTLDRLTLEIRMVDADTPADYDARIEVLDADRHEASYRAGFADGLDAGRHQRPGPAMGHDA